MPVASNVLSFNATTEAAGVTGTGAQSIGLSVGSSGTGTVTPVQAATGVAAFALTLLAACSGSGTVTSPQQVTGSGAQEASLSVTSAGTGTSTEAEPVASNVLVFNASTADYQSVTGSGGFTTELMVASVGTGALAEPQPSNVLAFNATTASVEVAGTGAFEVELTAFQTGFGILNPQMLDNTGSGENWEVGITVASSGTGVATSTESNVAGTGAFEETLTVTSTGSGTVTQSQQVIGTGTQVVSISTGSSGAGVAVQPQQITGNGNFTVGLTKTSSGAGHVIPLQNTSGTGAWTASLTVSSIAEGLVKQPIKGEGVFEVSLTVQQQGEGLVTSDTWDDGPANIWDEVRYNIADNTPVFVLGNKFFAADQGEQFVLRSAGEYTYAPVATVLERIGLPVIREGKPYPTRVKLIRGIYPIFEGTEGVEVNISVGVQQNTKKEVEWEGPHGFAIGEDFFSDFFVSGRYIAIRYETAALADWKLQGFDIDMQPLGER